MNLTVACTGFLLSVFAVNLLAQEPFSNETVLKLAKAGIGEDVIVGMVNQQPGRYTLSADEIVALKNAGVSDRVIAAMIVHNGSSGTVQPQQAAVITGTLAPVTSPGPLVLHDATPIRLRLNRNLTSADAKAGDNVDFEVLDDLKVDDVMLIARGGTAIATITEAEHKKRMARGGKLDVTIDYVRLVNGDKVALRAVKATKGGGHTGAMTGGIVATAIVFFPAAPFFLFMHGRDVTIPKGTEITAYVNGEIKLDRARFVGGAPTQIVAASPVPPQQANFSPVFMPAAVVSAANNGLIEITFISTPPNAVVSMGRMALGRTPFTTKLTPGIYKATFYATGYENLIQQVTVASGYPATVHANMRLAQ